MINRYTCTVTRQNLQLRNGVCVLDLDLRFEIVPDVSVDGRIFI